MAPTAAKSETKKKSDTTDFETRYHWSWMHILTAADLLVSGESIADADQTP